MPFDVFELDVGQEKEQMDTVSLLFLRELGAHLHVVVGVSFFLTCLWLSFMEVTNLN